MAIDFTRIVSAARELAHGPSRSAYATLVEGLYDAIDLGIARALARFGATTAASLADGHFAEFVARKLPDSAFLKGLVAADDPVVYVTTAAGNHVRDQLRKAPVLPIAEDDAGEVSDGLEHDELLIEREEHDARVRRFRALSDDDQLILAVLHVEFDDPSHADVERIARRRGVPPAIVRRELAERAHGQAERRREAQYEFDERVSRIASLQIRIWRVRAAIAERDGTIANEAPSLTAERLQQLRGSSAELVRASAIERAAYLFHLESRVAKLQKLNAATRGRLHTEFPAGPRYEDVLAILGELPEGDEARARAVNSLTVKIARLRKRLRERAAEEGIA